MLEIQLVKLLVWQHMGSVQMLVLMHFHSVGDFMDVHQVVVQAVQAIVIPLKANVGQTVRLEMLPVFMVVKILDIGAVHDINCEHPHESQQAFK